MEKIIEGKIEYDDEKYAFYYINNILTLIPDNNLENVWENIFLTLKERTINNEILLEGITSLGYRITFINVKLIKHSGGLYKCFVPAYIIGNANMMSPLPTIDQFDSMLFYGKCIDNFFSPQKAIILGEREAKFKQILSDDIEIENDIFNLGISKTYSNSEQNINTPIILKSFLRIKFKNKKSILEIIEYYRKVSELFEFLYSRKYIKFNKIQLTSKGKIMDEKGVRDTINTFDFCYYLPDEEKIDLPNVLDSVKYEQIKDYFCDIYLNINNKTVYKNYYNLNQEDEQKITINKYYNISSAFESWFHVNFPKFKSDTNEDYRMLKNKILDYIDECDEENDKKGNKEILSLFRLVIKNMEGSLKEQIKYSLELFNDCIVNLKNNLVKYYDIQYSTESELDEKIANSFKKTRNKIVHGNMKDEILFSNMDVVAYSIVERLIKCLVLYKSKVDIDKIKELVDDRF